MYCYADSYYNRMEKESVRESQLRDEMRHHRDGIFKKMAGWMPKEIAAEFAKTLSFGWYHDEDSAKKIAEELQLDRIDFAAIEDDMIAFEEEILKQQVNSAWED